MPTLEHYLGEKNALLLQQRVDHLLNQGIGFAAQKAVTQVRANGGISFDTRNIMVDWAVKYATDHAPDLATSAGNLTEKVLARFDTHPAVQGLVVDAASGSDLTPPNA